MRGRIGWARRGWMAGLGVLLATPSLAGTYTLTISNQSSAQRELGVRSVKVEGATPESYKLPGREARTFSIEVTMPEGLCKTRVSLFFESGIGRYPGGRADMYYDVCGETGISFR